MASEQERLAETIAWCSRPGRGDCPETSLRTPALHPEVPLMAASPGERQEVVADLCRQRRALLDAQGIPVRPVSDLAGGKVVAVRLEDVVGCRTSETESSGLFDQNDLPGWDCWFAYRENGRLGDCLLGWLPAVFLPAARDGINVSPTECIFWVQPEELFGTS
jgi:hypothetical protein